MTDRKAKAINSLSVKFHVPPHRHYSCPAGVKDSNLPQGWPSPDSSRSTGRSTGACSFLTAIPWSALSAHQRCNLMNKHKLESQVVHWHSTALPRSTSSSRPTQGLHHTPCPKVKASALQKQTLYQQLNCLPEPRPETQPPQQTDPGKEGTERDLLPAWEQGGSLGTDTALAAWPGTSHSNETPHQILLLMCDIT